MNTIISGAFLLALISPAAAAEVDQAQLAKQLIIPRVEMREADVEEVLQWAQRRSRDLDPQKKGLNLLFPQLPDRARRITWKEGDQIFTKHPPDKNLVTLYLSNVTMFDFIQRVASIGDLEVTARKDAIIVHVKGLRP